MASLILTVSAIRASSGLGSLSNNLMLVKTVEMFIDGCHAPCEIRVLVMFCTQQISGKDQKRTISKKVSHH